MTVNDITRLLTTDQVLPKTVRFCHLRFVDGILIGHHPMRATFYPLRSTYHPIRRTYHPMRTTYKMRYLIRATYKLCAFYKLGALDDKLGTTYHPICATYKVVCNLSYDTHNL